jgi:hypothetical protein
MADADPFWTDGVTLPAGLRSAVAADGFAWITTRPFDRNALLLTKMSLQDGTHTTVELDSDAGHFVGAGVSHDDHGHIWITYGDQVLRVDEKTEEITRWSLPFAGDPGEDTQLAQPAVANAWDQTGDRLLFVTYNGTALYAFSPATGAVIPLSELPITTSPVSRLAIRDGVLAVTGSAGTDTFVPAAASVVLATSTETTVPNIASLCATPSDIALLARNGDVRSLGISGVITTVRLDAPVGQVPFGCDDKGGVFEATVGDGVAVVSRISAGGDVATVKASLVPTGVVTLHGGINPPFSTWLNPGAIAIIGDSLGGAWLINETGTQSTPAGNESPASDPPYASVVHIAFAK